jgi:hypothetical protein
MATFITINGQLVEIPVDVLAGPEGGVQAFVENAARQSLRAPKPPTPDRAPTGEEK